ncbi:hypothetical protein NQ317_016166 [Molorchus minor]|uniref:GBD/FH3 domain-containing protein n=1 Tax=Molorchus minor TaxID=1323400 RepID=A0ABQ9JRA2_9CUCU|nr:hypothetical protein NQ317_016166 [Molorchus minor]
MHNLDTEITAIMISNIITMDTKKNSIVLRTQLSVRVHTIIVQTCVSDNLHLILSGGDGRKRQAIISVSMEIRLSVIKAVFLRSQNKEEITLCRLMVAKVGTLSLVSPEVSRGLWIFPIKLLEVLVVFKSVATVNREVVDIRRRELRRALFSLKQIFQEDKDLVHEFVPERRLSCLIKVGSEADQNYQNYILRALGQVMLYVDGMNGVMDHNQTIQWLYSLISSKFRLVVKTALKLLLVFA